MNSLNGHKKSRLCLHELFSSGASEHFDPVLLVTSRVAIDLIMILAAFGLGLVVYLAALDSGLVESVLRPEVFAHGKLAVIYGLVSLAGLWKCGLYRYRASVTNLWELQITAETLGFFALTFFLSLLVLTSSDAYPRLLTGSAFVLAVGFVLVGRRSLASVLGRWRCHGAGVRRVLIYGCGDSGRLLMKKFVHSPELGRSVIGFVDDREPTGSSVLCRSSRIAPDLFEARVLGTSQRLSELVAHHRIDELIIATPLHEAGRLEHVLQVCQTGGLSVGVVPQLGALGADQLDMERLGTMSMLQVRAQSVRPAYLVFKRLLDVLGSSVLLLLTAPFLVLTAILVRLDSPGPGFFVQDRIGLNGRRFRLYKLRTIRADAAPYAPTPVDDRDPRITRIGRILRKGGLDELPQLINVLRGEMSLVGPRPEMPFIVERYTPLQRKRLEVRPGLTGLWQISADRAEPIHENIEYDLFYARHQSWSLDLVLLFETAVLVLSVATSGFLCSLRNRAIPRSPAERGERPPLKTSVFEWPVLVPLQKRRGPESPPDESQSIA